MKKISRTTVSVKFRPSTVAGRPGRLVYQVTRCREVRQITTTYNVYPDEWDAAFARVVSLPGDEARRSAVYVLNRNLRWDLERLNRVVAGFEERLCAYTSADVVAAFRLERQRSTLYCYMESVILRLRQLKHVGTACNYRAALSSFKRFLGYEDIMLEAIDHSLLEDYQSYLRREALAPNSISFYMRIWRAVYNRAVAECLIEDRKPFHGVFTGMEKTTKRAISLPDIRRIKHLPLASRPALAVVRDLFLFLFYCRGMSFIDAAFLKKADIRNGVLSYRRHKTGQLLRIRVIRPISEIIERYAVADSPYLLPIITRPGADERKQYATALRRVNNGLKTIAAWAGLNVPLTTYVTRHAWATIAKSKNISVNIISDALGHDSISTTQIYLASVDAAIIDRANELIIADLY